MGMGELVVFFRNFSVGGMFKKNSRALQAVAGLTMVMFVLTLANTARKAGSASVPTTLMETAAACPSDSDFSDDVDSDNRKWYACTAPDGYRHHLVLATD